MLLKHIRRPIVTSRWVRPSRSGGFSQSAFLGWSFCRGGLMNPSLRSPVPSTPPSLSISSGAYRLSFLGSGGELFGVFFFNLLKTILTLRGDFFLAKVKT